METTYSLKLPPKSYRRAIEELSVVIPDPALKLKFLKQAIDEYQKISAPDKLDPVSAEVAFQKKLLDNAEAIWPGSIKAANKPFHEYVITAPPVNVKSKRQHNLRYVIGSAILLLLIFGAGAAVSPWVKSLDFGAMINQIPLQSKTSHKKIIIRKPIICSQPSNGGTNPPFQDVTSAKYQNDAGQVQKYLQSPVLTVLAPLRTPNTTSDLTAENPILVAHPGANKNHSRSQGVKSEKLKKDTGPLPDFLHNPILLVLTQQKSKNPDTDQLFQKLLWPTKTLNSENNLTLALDPTKSINHQKEPETVVKYFQNPVLMALVPQQTQYIKPALVDQISIPSSQMHHSVSQPAVANIKPDNHLTGSQGILKSWQNPVLIALSPHQSISSKTGSIARKPLLSSQISKSENRRRADINPEKQLLEAQGALQLLQNPILIALTSQQITSSKPDRIIRKPVLPTQSPERENDSPTAAVQPAKHVNKPVKVPKYLKVPVWLVEKTPDREFYSNRLQIITTHTISNIPREYYRFPKNSNDLPANSKIADNISGIVYHASESDLYPFMPEMNHSILKYSKQLIKFLQRKKSYHYFIDRFGRVYRVVREDHAAFHAGNSIWADDKEIYLNLNHAFIGICFEGKDFEKIDIKKQKIAPSKKSKHSRLKPTGISSFNEAQLRSGKELTDWLRVKYNIPQQNCVPHALISVNPQRMLIGYHLDLARGFPFAKFGLSDKYRELLPSIVEFGFRYDAYFKRIFNGDIWPGIHLSEEILRVQAGNSGMRFAKYRKSLQRRFSLYAEWSKKMLERKDQLAENLQKTKGKEDHLRLGKK